MFQLIQFEMKKIIQSTFFRILILAFLLFLVTYYIFIYNNTNRLEDITQQLVRQNNQLGDRIEELQGQLTSTSNSEVSQINQEIEFNLNSFEENKTKISLYEMENWSELLRQEIENVNPSIGSMKYNSQTHTNTWPTLFTLETFVEQSNWMKDKDIIPLLPLEHNAWLTIYDRDFASTGSSSESIREIFEKRSTKYSSTSVHFIYHFFHVLFSLFGVIFFLFLFGDVVTKEGLRGNGTIHLLYTQPIPRYKILISKFLTIMLFSFIILLCAVMISSLLGFLFDRFGNWDYPVLIYGEDRSFSLMSMGVFLLKAAGLFFMILLFCFSILFLYSIVIKRLLIAIGLTIMTLLLGVQLTVDASMSSFAPYIPFQYFSVPGILTNEQALLLDNFNISYINGIISLGVTSLVILVVTYIVSIVRVE